MKKKYALNNSYFKVNTMLGLPDTILEIAKYYKENGELPFNYVGSNWVYDAFCERQKRRGVINSQFLTPDVTADRMLHFAFKYFTVNGVLEPCCGTGQITKELLKSGYSVVAFDNDLDLVKLCEETIFSSSIGAVFYGDFHTYKWNSCHCNQIIANPPHEIKELTDFIEWICGIQNVGGISILLLPKGFIDKNSPKRTFDALRKFGVLEKEDMRENFERTAIKAEIVVLKKI
jgi:SAM-dependent methyltransferase